MFTLKDVKIRFYLSMERFWIGMMNTFDKLAIKSEKRNDIHLYRKYDEMFWSCSRKADICHRKTDYYFS